MKDTHPADGCSLEQGFAENATAFYKGDGLAGHPGRDKTCGYGTPIYSPVDGLVYTLFTPERPASDGYVAIYILVKTKLELFEFTIGHCSKIAVTIGQQVKKGDLIGYEGNKGVVYVGQTRITLAMQAAGDKRGSHRHYQKRVVNAAKKRTGVHVLTTSKGTYRTPDGEYLEWAFPGNGFNSCVDYSTPMFTKSLKYDSENYEVFLLQRALGLPLSSQTGYFGDKTRQALLTLQKKNGIDQTGTVGPKTREFLNARYGQLEDPILSPDPMVENAKDAVEAVANAPGISVEERRGFFNWIGSFIKSLQ